MSYELSVLRTGRETIPYVPSLSAKKEENVTVQKIESLKPKICLFNHDAYRAQIEAKWSQDPMIFEHVGVWQIFSGMLFEKIGLQKDIKQLVEKCQASKNDQVRRASADRAQRNALIEAIFEQKPTAFAVLELLYEVHRIDRALLLRSPLLTEGWNSYFSLKQWKDYTIPVVSIKQITISQTILTNQLEHFARILYDAYFRLKKGENNGNTSFLIAQEGTLKGLFSGC